MTRIYLVRHAEAEGNLYRIAQGQDNSNLTDRGWRQVAAVERRFADIHVDAVYASDLYRTCATASAIYKPKGLPLHRRKDLREICVGAWEQRTWGDIAREDAEQMTNFSIHPDRWFVEGAESPQQVTERVLGAAREIAAANEGKTVVLVSHGYAIRLLLAAVQGIPLADLAKTPVADNTAVSLIEFENGEMQVVFRDDSSHLKTPEYLAGEKVLLRASALEVGLYFRPLRLPEQAEEFAAFVEEIWRETGREPAFDRGRLLADAAGRITLVGFRQEEFVGVVQMMPEEGWLSLVCVKENARQKGFGAQLIGQAVLASRRAGSGVLRTARSSGEKFFADYGFVPVEDGTVLEKHIAFDPEFLSE